MNIQLFQLVRERLELNLLKKKIANITEEEKESINKIINFALTWWLKDVATVGSNGNSKDACIDMMYGLVSPLSEEQLASLENFKHVMGMTILKKLLVLEEPIKLHCGYTPDGILAQILQESNCQFLNLHLPTKSHMSIDKEQIWISEGYGAKTALAFDVHQIYDFGNSDVQIADSQKSPLSEEEIIQYIDEMIMKTESGEFILPRNFVPSNYDFLNMYIQEQNANNTSRKRFTR